MIVGMVVLAAVRPAHPSRGQVLTGTHQPADQTTTVMTGILVKVDAGQLPEPITAGI